MFAGNAPTTLWDLRQCVSTTKDTTGVKCPHKLPPGQKKRGWYIELEDAKNSEHTSSNSIVVVSGTLTIRERLNFELNQESNLTEANGTRTLNSLQETATGRCREQG